MENAMSKASFGSGASREFFTVGTATKVFSALRMRLERNRGARQLHALDDFMLKDIGLTRGDIYFASHGKIKRHG
jgi:uncharacterized protein YjiS (DUF1127 family)